MARNPYAARRTPGDLPDTGFATAVKVIETSKDKGKPRQWGNNTTIEKVLEEPTNNHKAIYQIVLHQTAIARWRMRNATSPVQVFWDHVGLTQRNGRPTRTTIDRLDYWLPNWEDYPIRTWLWYDHESGLIKADRVPCDAT